MTKYLPFIIVLLITGAACSKPTTNTNAIVNAVVNTTLNLNSSTTGSFTTNTAVSNTSSVTNTTTVNSNSTTNRTVNSSTSVTTGVSVLPITQRVNDSASTLSNPVKVQMTDGAGYFIIGQPKGQNSKTTKKIIFSLPGHGTTAETDYDAWKEQIVDHDYALASINWWDGAGETTQDYFTPSKVLSEITRFLTEQGYDQSDFVVLEGFSRGSANTYAVKSYDEMNQAQVIDAVISASGKYQSDFPLAPGASSTSNLFQAVPWILVCGEKDDNPTRDGCEGMSETKAWLQSVGATVLKLLEDPNGTHGAFHQSPLNLVDQALTLLDALPAAK